jgi:alpha-D-xyloside xylohydrolase
MWATLNTKTYTLRFADSSGKLLLEEIAGARIVKPSTAQGQPTQSAEDRFKSPEDESLFGSGQFQDGYLNIRDLPRHMTQVNSQISIPFLISSKGYGLLWHNYGLTDLNAADERVNLSVESKGATSTAQITTNEGTRTVAQTSTAFTGELTVPSSGRYAMMLDSGQRLTQIYHVEIDGKTVLDLENRWLPGTTGWLQEMTAGKHTVRVKATAKDRPALYWRASAAETTLRSAVSDGVDYVVFAGPRTDDIVKTYRQLSGQAPLMPLWAYGFIQCRERYSSSSQIVDTAMEFRDHKLPIDLIVQDWQYWGKYGWNAMQWDEKDYPDPAAMVKQLHDLHIKLMVSVWSNMATSTAVSKEFSEKGYLLGKSSTPYVDLFNPDAAALYWKNFSARMLSLGIDAWWLAPLKTKIWMIK